MTGTDGIQISVDARFCGPPGFANGGYLCGLIGSALGRTVTVRLNRPVPLEKTLDLLPDGEGVWQLQLQGQGLALVREATLSLQVPVPPRYVEALDASLHFLGFRHHPYPRCFVCGPDRAKQDGLRLFAGRGPARPSRRRPGCPTHRSRPVTARWRPSSSARRWTVPASSP